MCRNVAKLATMDIFAGCGGLTCGLHKAGAAETKWSIEYEQPAAEAFKYAVQLPQAFTVSVTYLKTNALQYFGP